MNAQEIFDTACAGVIAQGMQSVNGDVCMYRSERKGVKLKCAAGHLIPDEMYESGMERATWDKLVQLYDMSHFAGHQNLIISLQCSHDFCVHEDGELFIEEFIKEARYVAEKYELNTNVLENHNVKS